MYIQEIDDWFRHPVRHPLHLLNLVIWVDGVEGLRRRGNSVLWLILAPLAWAALCNVSQRSSSHPGNTYALSMRVNTHEFVTKRGCTGRFLCHICKFSMSILCHHVRITYSLAVLVDADLAAHELPLRTTLVEAWREVSGT